MREAIRQEEPWIPVLFLGNTKDTLGDVERERAETRVPAECISIAEHIEGNEIESGIPTSRKDAGNLNS